MKSLAKNYLALLCLFFLCHTNFMVHAGFLAGTLVKAFGNFATIENLSVGDFVDGFNLRRHGSYPIVYTRTNVEKPFCIVLPNETVITSQDQKFYLAPTKSWKKVKTLKSGELLFCNKENSVRIINVYEFDQAVTLFDATVEHVHTLFVFQYSMLVHKKRQAP